LIYGIPSETLTVLAVRANPTKTVDSLLDEVRISPKKIIWRAPAERRPHLKKKASRLRKLSGVSAMRARRRISPSSKPVRSRKAEPVVH